MVTQTIFRSIDKDSNRKHFKQKYTHRFQLNKIIYYVVHQTYGIVVGYFSGGGGGKSKGTFRHTRHPIM